MQQTEHKDNLTGKIVMGMAGVALTAGAVAAGAALMNPKTRNSLKRRVSTAAQKINEAKDYFGEQAEVYSHQLETGFKAKKNDIAKKARKRNTKLAQ